MSAKDAARRARARIRNRRSNTNGGSSNQDNAPYVYDQKSVNNNKIIGIRDPSLVSSDGVNYGFTLNKFDTASYPDRALLQLQNNTAGNLVMRDLSIRGKLVVQLGGASGYVWEYSDYDSIEKHGEQSSTIGNDFIIDPIQAADVGDNAWKILKPHDLYTLVLTGCQYHLDIGSFHTLKVDYVLPGQSGDIESIDVDVEILSVSFERIPGALGSTKVVCRKKIGAWNRSISKQARLVASGITKYNSNRNNIVTVAASTFSGPASYYCDGVADNVEIQAAIDEALAIGGEVRLTKGTFNASSAILTRANTVLSGEGPSTIVNMDTNILLFGGGDNPTISNIAFVNTTGPNNTRECLFFDTRTGGKVSGCTFAGIGYPIVCGDDWIINGNRFGDNHITAIRCRANSIISNNMFTNNFTGATNSVRTIRCNGDACIVEGNQFVNYNYQSSIPSALAVIESVGAGVSFAGNVISNITASSPDSSTSLVLMLGSGCRISNNTICNNTFNYSNTVAPAGAVLLYSSGSNQIISNNSVYANYLNDPVGSGETMFAIYANLASNSTISGNTLISNTSSDVSYGISLAGGSRIILTGNRVTGHTTNLQNTSTNLTNTGNDFT